MRNPNKIKSTLTAILLLAGFYATPVFAGTINIPPNYLALNSGLVGWWTMDGKDIAWTSSTAGTVVDKSGNGNTGTLTNMNRATAPSVGKVGQSLLFPSTGGIKITNNIADAANALTASFWVKEGLGHHNQVTYISKTRNINCLTMTPDNKISWTVTKPSNDKYTFCLMNSDGTAFSASSNASYTDAAWHLVVSVYDGSSIQVYVDGVAGTAVPASGSIQSSTLYPVCIGANNNDSTGGCNGSSIGQASSSIDDVRIYNRALSADEIKLLYNVTSGSRMNVSQAGPGNLNSGLVGWWTMDGKDTVWTSSTAGTVVDKSGNGNTGTLTNMNQQTSVAIGKIGQALQFNGNNQFVQLDSPSSLDITGPVTVSAWIKAGSTPDSQMGIAGAGCQSSGNAQYLLKTSTNGKLVFLVNNGTLLSTPSVSPSFAPIGGIWYQAVGTWDGTNLSLYIDGTFNNSVASSTYGALSSNIGIRKAAIGSFCSTAYWNGLIDDVRIYNRALSADEVAQLYNVTSGSHANVTHAGAGNLNSGLVGWWTMDGKDMVWTSSTAGTVVDKSGNGNTGTLTNMNQQTSVAIGKIGQGLQLDGVDDYLNIGSLGSFGSQLGDGFTFSAWVWGESSGTGLMSCRTGSYSQLRIGLNRDLNFGVTSGSLGVLVTDSNNAKFRGATGSGSIPLHTWTHVVIASIPSQNLISVYVNGASKTFTKSAQESPSNFGDCTITAVGADQNLSLNSYLKSKIDDVRIFNRVLSADEVKQLYMLGM